MRSSPVRSVDEEKYSWGFPLWHAASYAEYEMAEILIAAGADVNATAAQTLEEIVNSPGGCRVDAEWIQGHQGCSTA